LGSRLERGVEIRKGVVVMADPDERSNTILRDGICGATSFEPWEKVMINKKNKSLLDSGRISQEEYDRLGVLDEGLDKASET
jgi:hypothetical protein